MRVLATAGHVDHGKSTLVLRLTGIDPDRWDEEKRRGLTIDLGFAWLTLPDGTEVGIVDVPGHERFIENMLAGVTSVPAVLFVVDATEGWKPQSEEHLQILDLLEISEAVVALTKSDLVSDDLLGERVQQIEERLSNTTLAGSPIMPVSAVTGDGVDALLGKLATMLGRQSASPSGRARLFIDRSFTIDGAGTVVTGTLGEGTIAVGDDVQLVPSGRTVRVRGIQSHRSKRERLEPVARAAINLTGVVRSEVSRGDALVTGGPWRMAREILASVRPARYVERIKARGAFTLHLGTAHTRARIRFFDARDGQEMTELSAGIEAVAVIRLSDPLPVLPLDRFILRDTGARRVVAGGVILEIDPDRSQPSSRLDPTAGTRADVARGLCERRGPMPITTLLESCGIDEPPADLVAVGSWIMTAADFERLHAELAGTVSRFHAENPVAAGIKRVELVDILGWEPSLADAMISDQRTSVATDGVLVREASFQIQLPDGAQEIVRRFEVAGLKPPDAAEAGVSGDLIEALVRAGRLQRIGDLLFAETAVHHAEELVRATLSRGPATTSELRAVLGTSRKFAIPLLEHLDRRRVTRFDGERRSLVE